MEGVGHEKLGLWGRARGLLELAASGKGIWERGSLAEPLPPGLLRVAQFHPTPPSLPLGGSCAG